MTNLSHKYLWKSLSLGVLFIMAFGMNAYSQSKNAVDAQNRKQGYWEKVNANGTLVYKGQFKDDKPVGKFKYYNKSGAIISVLEYITSDTVKATHFYDNGTKEAYGYYVNQKKEGVWRFFDRLGVLASEEEYKNGVKHGKYIIYNLNGTISRETYFVNGLENGLRKTYDSDGHLLTEGTIKDGVMDGLQKIYRGGKLNVEGSYKHAVRDGEWKYYDENGQVYKTQIFELGTLKK